MSLVSIEGVTYTYPGATAAALDGVSLAIEPGEFIVIAGLSGSGKSTLLRAIGGLVPHFHGGSFAGSVRVGDLDTRDHGPGDLAALVGSLFQDPETQIVLGTPRAELAFAAENRGWAGSVGRARGRGDGACAGDRVAARSSRAGAERRRVAARGARCDALLASGARLPRRADLTARPGRR